MRVEARLVGGPGHGSVMRVDDYTETIKVCVQRDSAWGFVVPPRSDYDPNPDPPYEIVEYEWARRVEVFHRINGRMTEYFEFEVVR